MKNKFNFKNIIKKIKSNRAEETINAVLIVVAGLALVALFIGVVIGGGKNTINQTGGMIEEILNETNIENDDTSEQTLINLEQELQYWIEKRNKRQNDLSICARIPDGATRQQCVVATNRDIDEYNLKIIEIENQINALKDNG